MKNFRAALLIRGLVLTARAVLSKHSVVVGGDIVLPLDCVTCRLTVVIGHDGREALSLGKALIFNALSSVNVASGTWRGVAQVFLSSSKSLGSGCWL